MPGSIHRGICVSDLIASKRFYREACGFLDYGPDDFAIVPAFTAARGIPNVQLRTAMLHHPQGPVIELVQFLHPAATGSRAPRSTLEYGLLHLSFFVEDLDEAIEKIISADGASRDHTRAQPEGDNTVFLYATDPDGVRVELVQAERVPEGFSHGGLVVEDLETSMSFYGILGFKPAERYEYNQRYDWLERITEVKDIRLTAQMMRDQAGNCIELLKVASPANFRNIDSRPTNIFGLSYLAFWVDDPKMVVKALSEMGGHFFDLSDPNLPGLKLIQGADPDGVRIEIRQTLC